MELGERVNAAPARWENTSVFSPRPPAGPDGPPGSDKETGVGEGLDAATVRTAGTRRPTSQDEGPCLYLGPAGQRCDRRALKGGFCAWHQPGAERRKPAADSSQRSKRLAAAIAIIAALWPVLMQFLHALAKFFR